MFWAIAKDVVLHYRRLYPGWASWRNPSAPILRSLIRVRLALRGGGVKRWLCLPKISRNFWNIHNYSAIIFYFPKFWEISVKFLMKNDRFLRKSCKILQNLEKSLNFDENLKKSAKIEFAAVQRCRAYFRSMLYFQWDFPGGFSRLFSTWDSKGAKVCVLEYCIDLKNAAKSVFGPQIGFDTAEK